MADVDNCCTSAKSCTSMGNFVKAIFDAISKSCSYQTLNSAKRPYSSNLPLRDLLIDLVFSRLQFFWLFCLPFPPSTSLNPIPLHPPHPAELPHPTLGFPLPKSQPFLPPDEGACLGLGQGSEDSIISGLARRMAELFSLSSHFLFIYSFLFHSVIQKVVLNTHEGPTLCLAPWTRLETSKVVSAP